MELGIGLGIVILLINALALFQNTKQGITWFVILGIVCPNVHVSGIILSYQLFAFAPLALIYFIKRPYISCSAEFVILYSFLVLLIISSIISSKLNNVPVAWISILGNVRFVVITMMLTFLMKHKKNAFEKILLVAITINLLFAIIQISIPKSVYLFYDFYYKESMTPLQMAVENMKFNRSYGSFGTPVLLGVFSLISFSYFFSGLINKEKTRQRTVIYGFSASTICGILALSKTFILGAPIVVIITVLVIIIANKGVIKLPKSNKIIYITAGCTLFIGIAVIVLILNDLGWALKYYSKYLLNPFKALATRYEADEGILNLTMEVIKENIFIGVGETIIKGEFNGDSMYIQLLHSTGIIGLIMVLVLFIIISLKTMQKNNFTGLIVLLSFMVTGIGANIFASLFGALVIAFASVSNNNRIKIT
jgi:hypothetical protein